MMSYLWILLLGSLLATSAKAQDDDAPTEEKAAPETPALEADTATEVNEEPAADKETEPTAEEIPPPASEPEQNQEAEAGEPVIPVAEEAEPAATPAADTEAGAGVEVEAEAEEKAEVEVEAEAAVEAEAEAKAEVEVEAEAGAVAEAGAEAEAEAEAATTEQADLEVIDPKADEPTALEEEEATSSTGVPQEEIESEATSVADPAVADDEEKAIVPDAAAPDAVPTKPAVDEKVEPEVEVLVTTIKVEVVPEVNADVELNLEDALPELNAGDNPGQRRSVDSGPHASGTSGDADKPEAQEASSGSLAGILSTIGVAIVGAIVGYYTYQKKKLCFKSRQEADPEAARKAEATEAQADPQVLSNLLNSS